MIHVASHFLTGIVESKQVVLIYFFLVFMYLFLVYLIPATGEKPFILCLVVCLGFF